jgi:ABC-type phosphate transport system permease subunit
MSSVESVTAPRDGVQHATGRRLVTERASAWLFGALSAFPLVLTIVMVLALAARARPVAEGTTIWALLTGQTWLPLEGQFGYFPFIAGTLWVTILAMLIPVPPFFGNLSSRIRQTSRTGVRQTVVDLLAAIHRWCTASEADRHRTTGEQPLAPWLGSRWVPAARRG